ncbi:MAG: ribbon-helix-helix protein, CopG family [Candidatus Binataceae bacterium]
MGTIAVRLNSDSEAILKRLVRETGRTESELVRAALTDFLRRKSGKKVAVRPYDLMKDGIGCWSSGGPNLSERTGEKFTQMLLQEKRAGDTRGRRGARQISSREYSKGRH